MSRNPYAASLRAHKPRRIEDKRDAAEREALDEEAAIYICGLTDPNVSD